MEKNILLGVLLLGSLFFANCTPDRYEYHEPSSVDMGDIGSMKLYLSHSQLLANGKAEIEFTPVLTTKDNFNVADARVDHSQIEYYSLSGDKLSKNYSTSDVALYGTTCKVYAKIIGTEIVSDTLSFEIIDPSAEKQLQERIIPIVFHLIQSDKDITSYGGKIPAERMMLLLDKINNAFAGSVSRNATGVDTKIQFKPALYGPYGNKLSEPGIDRICVNEVADAAEDKYASFIIQQKALWNPEHYLNIWLLSDSKGEYENFYSIISTECIPRFVTNVSPEDYLPGLQLNELPEGKNDFLPNEVGIVYKLQSLFSMSRVYGPEKENELTNCLGYYLGLLPTWGDGDESRVPEDYCSDTPKYYGDSFNGVNIQGNKQMGKCVFLSENIMDDPTGVHRSVTLKQALRMHWVLEHCVGRSAWKSDYAFTGK